MTIANKIEKLFIIAGNYFEYKNWVQRNHSRFPDVYLHDFVYVNSTENLLGYRNPHGFFIGTYRRRLDIYEIATIIYLNSPGMDKEVFWNKVLPPSKPKHETN